MKECGSRLKETKIVFLDMSTRASQQHCVCYAPSMLFFIIDHGFPLRLSENSSTIVWLLVEVLQYSNSCINPFVYAGRSSGITRGIRRLITGLCQKNSENNGSIAVDSIPSHQP